MQLTEHAAKRLRQRGISDIALDIILNYGRFVEAPGGAYKLFVGKKEHKKMVEELKRAIQLLDKVKGGTMVIANEKILTGYKG